MGRTGLIVTAGKSTEHIKTSIQCYNPDFLMVVTSKELASNARRRLKNWKIKYGLDGEVFAVEDLFGEDGAEQIMTQTLLAFEVLRLSECDRISLGITGGTMHMAAAATSIAGIVGIPVFYVKKPNENEVVQPNKDVIEMPTLNGFQALGNAPSEAIIMLFQCLQKEDEEQGIITHDDANSIEMPLGYLSMLQVMRVVNKYDENSFKLTFSGSRMVKILYNHPTIKGIIKEQIESQKSETMTDSMFM